MTSNHALIAPLSQVRELIQVDCRKAVDSTRDQQPCVDCTVVAGQRIEFKWTVVRQWTVVQHSTRDQQPCVDCTVVAGQRIDSSGLS